MLLKRLAALGTRGTGPAAQRWEGLVFSGALLLQELLTYPRACSHMYLNTSDLSLPCAGVSDMAMDLDESRWERSGVPTRRLFPCLEPGAWQRRVTL